MESLAKLALELKRVADLNSDMFQVRVEITVGDTAPKSVLYKIVCEESEDHHGFLAVRDADLDQAAIRAFALIPDACKGWGYKH